MKLFTVRSALSSGSGSQILKRDIELFCCFFKQFFLAPWAPRTILFYYYFSEGRHLFELISVLTELKRTEKQIDWETPICLIKNRGGFFETSSLRHFTKGINGFVCTTMYLWIHQTAMSDCWCWSANMSCKPLAKKWDKGKTKKTNSGKNSFLFSDGLLIFGSFPYRRKWECLSTVQTLSEITNMQANLDTLVSARQCWGYKNHKDVHQSLHKVGKHPTGRCTCCGHPELARHVLLPLCGGAAKGEGKDLTSALKKAELGITIGSILGGVSWGIYCCLIKTPKETG